MANRPASYQLHIRPLFTAQQINCMSGYFDLSNLADVKQNAQDIYGRLQDKSMPADATGPWPDEWIALFQRWINEGCAP
ncbi:hypothetical protein [Burkholderia stagnalis]|uniref:hypothetical protein n=1 Tax=Burkholderia stagnalis TaxID=1503054 RepID=UPI000A543ABC|nr:hypothetical protein [Burkholderia stagnalis]